MRRWMVFLGLWLATTQGWSQQILWVQPVLTGQAIAYAPNNQLLATPTEGNRVAVYQAGQLVRMLSGAAAPLNALAFSSDNQFVAAVGNDGKLYLWRLSDGTLLWQVSALSGAGRSIAYIDGTLIAAGGENGQLGLYRASDGTLVRSLSGHAQAVGALAVSPDRTQLVSLDESGQARCWRISDGASLQQWNAHTGFATAVVWSPDGTRLATAAADGHIRLWVRNAQGAWVQERVLLGAHEFGVAALAFANPTLLYSAGMVDGKIRRWNATSGAAQGEFNAHADGIVGMALRPDGNEIATSGLERQVRLWNPATGAAQGVLGGHGAPVVEVGFTASGDVISASYDQTLRLWSGANGAPQGNPVSHNAPLSAASVVPSGAQVALGDNAGNITLRALPSGASIRTWNAHNAEILCLAYSPDGSQLLSGGFDGLARLWNASTGVLIRSFSGHGGAVHAVAFGNGVVATGDSAGRVVLWNPNTGAPLRTLEAHSDLVQTVVFSPSGALLLTGGADGAAKLWRVSDGTPLRTFAGTHAFGVTSALFINEDYLLTADGEGYLRLYAVQTGDLVGQWQPTPVRIEAIAYRASEQLLALGGDEGVLLLRFTGTPNRPPGVPSLIAPGENATLGRTPTFRVRTTDPDNQAVRYEIEIDRAGQRRVLQSAFVASGAEVSLAISSDSPLTPGAYTWRARAFDEGGASSDWSLPRNFTVSNTAPGKPVLLEPANGATVSDRPLFRLRLSDADSDRCRAIVRISGANNFDRFLESALVASGSEATLTLSEVLPPGAYTWQARTVDEHGAESDWTDAWAFTVPQPNRPPSVPERLAPANNATVSPVPTFRLRATDPDNDRVKLVVQLELESGETRTLESGFVNSGETVAITVPNTQPLPVGTHRWRVRALDNRDALSDWTERWNLQVRHDGNGGDNDGGGGENPPSNRPPGVPERLAPANNATVSPTPTFRLRATDPDNDAVNFEIEVVASDQTYTFATSAVASGEVATLRLATAQRLPAGNYRWRARTRDAAGNFSEWSEAQTLTVSDSIPEQLSGVRTLGLTLRVPSSNPRDLNLGESRIVEWDPAARQYRDAAQLQIGRGYFIKADTPIQPELSGDPITGEVRIPLQPGWNLISNPYLTALAWDETALRVQQGSETRTLREAHAARWIENYAWLWNAEQRQYQLVYDSRVLPNAISALPPGAGAWILAWQPCELILQPSGRGVGRSWAPAVGVWSLRIQARAGEAVSEVVLGAGRSVQASAPPSAPEMDTPVQVRLRRAQQTLAADVRAEGEPRAWTLEVQVAPAATARPVELHIPDLARLPRSVQLALHDEQTGQTVPLRGRTRYAFVAPAEGGVFRFRVEQASQRTLLRILQPTVSVGRGGSATIQATLSAPAQVQVHIVAGGRTVRTLPVQFTRSAGLMQVVWDGRDDAGSALPPGSYFVQLTARSEDGQTARVAIPLILTR
ncbi:MAG: hypothetical protein NZ874_10005 [Fimbriimonadales bacterium]|nr:hypothetical protein [Fimbriimonadales bacterium]